MSEAQDGNVVAAIGGAAVLGGECGDGGDRDFQQNCIGSVAGSCWDVRFGGCVCVGLVGNEADDRCAWVWGVESVLAAVVGVSGNARCMGVGFLEEVIPETQARDILGILKEYQ